MQKNDLLRVIELYSSLLKIDRDSLDEEIIEQSANFHAVGQAYSIAKSLGDKAYERTKVIDSELYVGYREDAIAEGKKLTEIMVNSLVMTDSKHEDAATESLEFRRISDQLSILKESFQQRSYMLRELVQLYVSDYFSTQSVLGQRHKAEVRQHTSNLDKIKEDRAKRKRKVLGKEAS